MTEIYASWCPGIVEDKEALKMIKNSGVLAGIELSNTESIPMLEEAEIKFNLHNPLFRKKMGLDHRGFADELIANPSTVIACKKSSPPALGFHAGYEPLDNKNTNPEQLVATIFKNLKFLDESLDKKIIFESAPYAEPHFANGDPDAIRYFSSPEFFKRIISRSNAGYLFDICHNLASWSTKSRRKEYKGEVSDYFSDILDAVAKETYQMHLNSPKGNLKEGIYDGHLQIKPSQKNSKLALMLAEEVKGACPNLKVITLEISTGLPPKKHAQILIKQAKLIEKKIL